MTLTVKLDEQDRNRLDALIAAMNVGNRSDVVRKLINDRFVELQAEKSLVERRGGHPKHLLQGAAKLSTRAMRQAVVANKIKAKAALRQAK